MRRADLRAQLDAVDRMKNRQEAYTKHLVYRLRVLPSQLETARLRVERLEREARALGLTHLLEGGANEPLS